jgi:hypothetical protein
MKVIMSWARSTLANVDAKLGQSEQHFDYLLVGVILLLALASVYLFSQ